uniref:Peptidase S26 domain-containing protein n=1 Tax=Rhinopithecus roxellana TaxID=61622 RepID=A0A2K6PY51_RHIRO
EFCGILGKTFRLGCAIQYGCIVYGVVMCSGPSVEPTIQNSDIVFAENLSVHFCGIQRGDIVIAKSPNDPKSRDQILTTSPSDFFKSHSYVPVGHVWLEDSRYYGPIPYGLIREQIFFKIWPLSDFEFLRASPNGHRFSDDW